MDLNLNLTQPIGTRLTAYPEKATAKSLASQELVCLRSNYGKTTGRIDIVTSALTHLIARLRDRYLVSNPPKRLVERRATSVILATVEDGRLHAWAGFYIIPLGEHCFYVGGVAVDADRRGKGLMPKLLAREMLRIEALYGPDTSFELHLRVYEGEPNPNGGRTFAKVGYHNVGPEKLEIYTGEFIDVHRMRTSADWTTRAYKVANGIGG